jgi:hypothetical protein
VSSEITPDRVDHRQRWIAAIPQHLSRVADFADLRIAAIRAPRSGGS